MRDVAALAGVGVMTVSRVVNARGGVSPQRAARVWQAIEKLDYRHNITARHLRLTGQPTASIGVLLEDVANPFAAELLRAVENVVSEQDCLVLCASSDGDPAREQALLNAFCARRVDGLIIVPCGPDYRYLLPELRRGTQVVFADRPAPTVAADTVISDNFGGARLADTLAESIVLRYPGLPPAAFAQPATEQLREFRHRSGLRQDSVLISTLGRLEEEKGLDTLVAMAELAVTARPELEFVIAGTGSLGDQLAERARTVENLTVLRNISSHDAQCLRATSEIGVFPTRVIPGFIETFCVAALEYEALGVPVLASAIGGVPEAIPDDRFLVAPDTAAVEWLARIDEVLANRAERSAVAAAYAGRFTSARSAQRLIDLANLAADRLNRQAPLKADPVDDYLATWPSRLPLRAEIPEPAQM